MTEIAQTNLNLARKWRPQTFDTVVGQDIPMRMLKNSLYLNKFFPVYLFAGQRGCGKTTSARIFAAAANCLNLGIFQANPKSPIPCLTCASCLAMHNGNHPDFIEIDAASHTGVDNVRNIIDSSSYMPLIGQRKIYLIDEAHMLSKAAFNALLKLLEEPPKNVIFMLATTESGKIPATVLSRCFQLIFPALPQQVLHTLLTDMCSKEGVSIDAGAINILLQETEGSARDAINLLERVRFSSDVITEDLILSVLGKMSNKTLIALMKHIVGQRPTDVLQTFISMGTQAQSPTALWDGLIQLAKTLLWIKYGITDVPLEYQQVKEELFALAEDCSRNRLHAMLTLLWQQERIFNQTSKKQLFIETVLLQLCDQTNIADLQDLLKMSPSGGTNSPSSPPPVQQPKTHTTSPVQSATTTLPVSAMAPEPILKAAPQTVATKPNTEEEAVVSSTFSTTTQHDAQWETFVAKIKETPDNLLISIFSQAKVLNCNDTNRKVTIALSTNGSFFKNKIEETTAIWQPFLQATFNDCNGFIYASLPSQPNTTTGQINRERPLVGTIPKADAPPPIPDQAPRFTHREKDAFLVIKDPEEWPTASLLLEAFSGKIKKVSSSQP